MKKRSTGANKGKKGRLSDEWEGLVDMSMSSTGSRNHENKLRAKGMPSFDALNAMFVDDEPVVKFKKKDGNKIDVRQVSDSEQDSEGPKDDESDQEVENAGKDPKKSGLFDKASSTKLIKRVLHVHAMLDEDETMQGRDLSFHELSFNMLVAGELEIILNSAMKVGERWSRLQLLKRLAYKAQFFDI